MQKHTSKSSIFHIRLQIQTCKLNFYWQTFFKNHNMSDAKIPEEVLWHVFLFLPKSQIYQLRKISPQWNRICSSILEERECITFTKSRQMDSFISRMPRRLAFGTYPQISIFDMDINEMVASDGGFHPSAEQLVSRFDEVLQAVQRFNQAWGQVVKNSECDLQLIYAGVASRDLFQETVNHLLTYFENVEHLDVKLPIVHLSGPEADSIHIPPVSRSRLLTLSLNLISYTGGFQENGADHNNDYTRVLNEVIARLLSHAGRLESLEIISDEVRRCIAVNGILENAGALSVTLTRLVLTSIVSNDELAQLVTFTKLIHVELCLDTTADLISSTLGNFLHACAFSVKNLTVRFIGTGNNSLRVFPPNSAAGESSVWLSNLTSLTLWKYGNGLIKLYVMPNLASLHLYSCNSLKIACTSFDNKMLAPLATRHQQPPSSSTSRKSPLLSVSGLRDFYLYEYSHRSVRQQQVPSLLLTSLLTSITFEHCEFSHHELLLGSVFGKCSSLRKLSLIKCTGLEISDASLCGGYAPLELPTAITKDLMNAQVTDENLRLSAKAYDTSNVNRCQISNLKNLRSLVIKEESPVFPITDISVLFGFVHCTALQTLKLKIATDFSEKARRLLQTILPQLDITKLNFN